MRLFSLLLVILGGINWGLVGLANINAVAAIFGGNSLAGRGFYLAVGLAALCQLGRMLRMIDTPLERHALTS